MESIDFLSLFTNATKKQRVVDGFCHTKKYKDELSQPDENLEQVLMVPNEESRYDFANRIILEFIQSQWRTYKTEIAIDEARETAIAEAKEEL